MSRNVVRINSSASTLATGEAVLVLVVNENRILKLSVVVLTNHTKNGNEIAYLRLVTGEVTVLIVVLVIQTINVNTVLRAINHSYDIHITVDVARDLLNGTGNVVMLLSVLILNEISNHIVNFLNSKGSNSLNGYGEFLGLGNLTGCSSSLELDALSCGGNGNGKRTAVKSSAIHATISYKLPADRYIGKSGEGGRKGGIACNLYDTGNIDVIKSCVNLYVSRLVLLNEVGKGSCRNRHQIEVAVVYSNDTNNISRIVEVCLEGLGKSLTLCLRNAVGGRGNSQVGLVVTKLEIVVAVAIGVLKKRNTADFYKHTVLIDQLGCTERGGGSQNLGIIYGGYRLDGRINHGSYRISKLEGTVVIFLITYDTNGHTNRDGACGIICKVVSVVSAIAVQILKEKAVFLGRVDSLGDHAGNDTLNDQKLAVLCRNVFVKGVYRKCGDRKLEAAILLFALVVLDRELKSVADGIIAKLGNVYNVEVAVLTLGDSNRCIVGAPGNREDLFADGRVLHYLEAVGRRVHILVGQLNIIIRCLKIRVFLVVVNDVVIAGRWGGGVRVIVWVFVFTCDKSRENKNEDEK